ncbi:putative clindamycin resistance transfer factor [Bacteroides faecis CAG:32]|nr:putative clindamycin resistance transfer factor [Bacteroides faecis CAG:32]
MPNSSRKTIFTTISIDKETAALVEKLALRGKAFGFSVLQEHTVMTPVISIFFATLIIRYLSIHISIKK